MTQARSFLGFFSLIFLISLAHANTRPVISFAIGNDHTQIGSTTNITFIPPFFNTYVASNKNDTELLAGLFVGAESDLYPSWALQYGISYYQTSSFQENGTVNQFGDPVFANLNYRYQIQSRRVSLETKLLYLWREIFHPYLNFGLGEATNRSYAYTESPITSDAVPMQQPFGNQTYRSLIYIAGLGVDVDLSNHVRLGVAYRFIDLGKAGLATSPIQTSTNTIETNHLYTNEFLLQLSYLG